MNSILLSYVRCGAVLAAAWMAATVVAAEPTNRALTRHAPIVNGTIEGSIRETSGESMALNSGAVITGDLLVPGTPAVRLNGSPSYGGTLDGAGSAAPSNYQITLNGGCALRHVIRRTDPAALAAVAAPPPPTGTRNVIINRPGADPGDFRTLRNLILNGNTGQYAIPPGTYGEFTANSGSGFTLGVAGAAQPSTYNFQRLTLNGSTQLRVVGPVIVTLAGAFTGNGSLGSSPNPAWLTLNVSTGGITLNGGCVVYALVNAPGGTAIINGSSQLIGGLTCDRLIINSGGWLRLVSTATNHPPVAANLSVALDEDTTAAIALNASDGDGDRLTYAVVTAPAHGTLEGAAPSLSYRPAPDFNGADSFTYKAGDGQADSNTATVTIAVKPVNDAPAAVAQNLVVAEDTSAAVTLTGADADGDPLTFSILTPPAHGTLRSAGASLTYVPAADYCGPDSFAFAASDGALQSPPATVAIAVTPVNDAPTANAQHLAVNEGETLPIVLTGADVDGDSLSFAVLTAPAHGVLSGAAPNLSYRPEANFGGTDGFTFRVGDGTAESAPATVTIQVTNLNDPPAAHGIAVTTAEDTPVAIALSGSDPDGDAIAFAIVSPPAHGTLGGSGASLTYTPAENYHGPDSFSFMANDGALDSKAATAAITVTPVNDAPVAEPLAVEVMADGLAQITLAAADVDGDALTFALVTPPAHGEIGGTAPGLTYAPAPGYTGPDSFVFRASDGALESEPALVSIAVVPPPNAPPAVEAGPDTTAILRPESAVKPYSNIIINHDEWTLTEAGFANSADAGKFARNLAHWITGGKPGRFLAYTNCAAGSVAEAFTGPALRAALEADGHAWETSSTIPFTLDNLKPYDAVFLSANVVDNQVLTDYVNAGGSVYISGGTKRSGQDADIEAGWYNAFLNRFGLGFGHPYNGVVGTLPVYSNHPIFAGVHQLYYANGNPVVVLDPADPKTAVIDRFDFKNLMAIYSRSLERADVALAGSASDDGQPAGATVQAAWSVVSGPGPVYFADPSSPATTASFSVPGTYVLRLAASDTEQAAADDVTITVESNAPPTAYAGPDVASPSPAAPATLHGEAADDGRPLGSSLGVTWDLLAGPGTAALAAPNSLTTEMTVSAPGIYVARLTASDGATATADTVEARFGAHYPSPAPPGLAAWWTANHTAQDAVSGREAEMLNDVHFAPGKVSEAFEFDGIDDAVHVPASADTDVGASPAGLTIEFWLKPKLLDNRFILAWKNGDLDGLCLQQAFGAQRIWARIKDTSGQDHGLLSPAFLTADAWQHIAFTYDRVAGEGRIYRNGILAAVQNLGSFTAQTSYDFYLGARPRDYLGCYAGCLDEVALYRRPLSADEILAIWQADIFGKCPLDGNKGPLVDAGPALTVGASNQPANLAGSVTDDGLPAGHALTASWSMVAGPGNVAFADATASATTASFDAAGVYLLRLSADDGAITTSDSVEVRVAEPVGFGYPPGLSAWWTANGHPREFLGRGPDLQFFNGAACGSGICSQGVHLDGVDDIVRIPASSATNVGAARALTIEFWFKRAREADDVLLVFKNRGGSEGLKLSSLYSGSLMAANLVDTAGAGHSFNTAAGVFAGQQWQHLALTYDAATGLGRLYRNGQLVKEQALGSFTPQTGYDVWLGSDPDRNYLGGDLDEITFYNRALTAAETQGIYSAGAFGKSPVPYNAAPVVNAGAVQSAYVGIAIALAGTAADDGLPNPPAALASEWSKVSGPGNVIFGSPAALVTTATFDTAGAYVLRLFASDSERSGADQITVTVSEPPSQPPRVTLTTPADQARLVAGVPLELTAEATDSDGTIARVEFFQGAANLGDGARRGPNAYSFALVAGLPIGSYTFTARATDNTGISATSAPVEVTVIADPGTPPVAQISAPAEDMRISAPTPVTGVVASPILASWALECRLKAAEGETPAAWATLATGTAAVGSLSPSVPGPLGTFDPTLLLNGIYELRLRAVDGAGRTLIDGPITLVVEGSMKVGAFTVAFEDLKIPLAGIPIQVIRTYDSRDSRVGDFGPGWRMAVNSIRLQKNRNLGQAWFQTLQSGTGLQFYCVDPAREPIVTVTFPDGQAHRFRAGAVVKKRPGDPDDASFVVVVRSGRIRFYPLGDTTSTLEPLDSRNELADTFWIAGTGENDLTTDDLGLVVFNPTRFRLTTRDGTAYILDERLGLLEMRDLNGNTLVLSRDGQDGLAAVVSSQAAPGGPVVRTVTIHRDDTGQVDYIRDPAGHDLDYVYDEQGRLSAFANRELNVTQFAYENASFPNYLTKIIDPRGVTALRCEFDAGGRLVKQIDAEGGETVFGRGIDATGRFEKLKDRLGHETTYYYDDRGNIVLAIDPAGARTSYTYYPDSDWVKFETDHYGNVKAFAYDARGQVTVETEGANASEDPANPTVGYTTHTTYNDRGAPTRITDPDGRVQTFTYDPATNHLLTHTVGVGGLQPATTTYTYNGDGTLIASTDALGNVTSRAYDYAYHDAGFPSAVKAVAVTVTDPAGAAGSDPANAAATVLRLTRTLYDAQENQVAQVVTRTLPGGGAEDVVTRFLYNAENRLVATLQPDGKVAETRYNAFGRPEASVLWKSYADFQNADDAVARVTRHGYDDRGNPIATTYADGSSEQTHYDAENRRDWTQDRLGHVTTYQYDTAGRLRLTTFPGGGSRETVYDLIGRVTDSFDELRHRTRYLYYPDGTADALRRKQVIVAPDSSAPSVTSYQYDRSGNVRYVTDPRGNTVETQYDEWGRPRFVIYPPALSRAEGALDDHASTQIENQYNALGQRTAVVDQEGAITRYRYDGLGRLVEVRQYLDQSLAAGDADLHLAPETSNVASTRYAYDELGTQISQIDALGRVTVYHTDSVGRRTARILPDGAAEHLEYDEWGNLAKRTDFAGKTTVFTYDALNRLKTKTADMNHPSLVNGHAIARVEFDYDANGARTAARTYNKDNVPLYGESTPRTERGWIDHKDAGGVRLAYSYFANGLLRDVVSSNNSGVNVGYRYDELNRLASVDDGSGGVPVPGADGGSSPPPTVRTTNYTYNANGSLETVAAPSGVTHTYAYDTLNRLRMLGVASSLATVHSYTYSLSPGGHRLQVVEGPAPSGPGRTTTYAYDGLYRLTSESVAGGADPGQNGTVTYTLDKVGNRLARSV
ncbi:MAG TPA: Ig-like domain-containing protein, partial [Opitutaceae bacterium]|nr:Ig-like domain-containing protein [Opitutaceae bacterium]